MPERIQRKRTPGWRLPPNAVYVGRPSKWGNPFAVGQKIPAEWVPLVGRAVVVRDAAEAVELHRKHARFPAVVGPEIRKLRGKDLACWCPLDQPCHADVLLEWANAPEGER